MAPWNATGACTILDRERPVQVLHDGAWVDGHVTAQRRDPDGWWAFVRYSTGGVARTKSRGGAGVIDAFPSQTWLRAA